MSGKQNAHTNIETLHYLSVIEPILETDEVADFVNVTGAAVRAWKTRGTNPRGEKAQRLGELAACMRFLDCKIGFTPDESRLYLHHIHLDPDTYESTTMWKQLQTGNTPLVIQKAIQWSVEGSLPE